MENSPTLPNLGELSMENIIQFSTNVNWGVSNPERFARLMEEARTLVSPGYFFGDNLFTWGKNNSALEDPSFRLAWKANIQNGSDEAIVWRRYILHVQHAIACIYLVILLNLEFTLERA